MTDIREQEMQQEINELKSENAYLKQQVSLLKNHLYGRKTEKQSVVVPPEQMSLFNEAEVEARKSEPEPTLVVKEYKRKKKKVGHRKELLEKLPHTKVVLEPTEAEKICPACGSTMSYLGEEFIRSEIHYIPARIEVIDYYSQSYECRKCRNEETPVILKPELPKPVIPHSIASPSAVAHIMMQKYGYAMPLYRQETEWQRIGLPLTRATMANWIILAAQEWLYPLIHRLHERLLQEMVIHAYETPVQVHNEKGKKNTSKSYMWVYTTGPYRENPAIRLFTYCPSRSIDWPEAFLKGYTGFLMTDDYSGYNFIPADRHCLCFVHARRKFTDAKPTDEKDWTGTLVEEAVRKMGNLFHMDNMYASLSADERKEKRNPQSPENSENAESPHSDNEADILRNLFAWAKQNQDRVIPKSAISKALNYLVSNETGLTTYLKDGHCALSNNIAENAIRPFTVGRKNWLFINSPKGAAASAAVYSIIETCKANQINPEEYLQLLFEKAPNDPQFTQPEILDTYLPWNLILKETNPSE